MLREQILKVLITRRKTVTIWLWMLTRLTVPIILQCMQIYT